MRNKKGFTLVELIIVIAITGILAAIAAPNLTNLMRKNRIENSTRRIYSDLMNTRVMAMDRNMTHFFRILGATNSYEINADTSSAGANFETYDGGDTRVLQRGGPDLVPFTFTSARQVNDQSIENSFVGPNNMTVFNARGLSTNQGAICVGRTVNVRPSADCVIVNTTRIRMGTIANRFNACGVANCNAIP